MIRVRNTSCVPFNTEDGTTYMSGPQLIDHCLHENEGSVAKFEVLTEIVGRLVERMPADQWLDIVGSCSLVRVR